MKRLFLVGIAASMLWGVSPVWAGDTKAPEIYPGAVEVGVSGSFKRQEGVQTGTVWARTGMFAKVPGGVGGAEVALGYTHESSLNVIDLEAVVNWGRRLGTTGNYPYVSVGGGWRHDNVGSFSQSRYPLGFGLGIRALIGQNAGFRLEYRFRRILGDPVANFSEHEIVVGVSIFFKNATRD
jgi:hypothetical protein